MAKLIYYAMPNHLRPSVSADSLSKGIIDTPTGFKDRVYLTDIGEICWQVAEQQYENASIKLLWNFTYFPWKITIRLPEGKCTLRGRKIGESTWTSIIALYSRTSSAVFHQYLAKILVALGRQPYETRYWNGTLWEQFERKMGLSKADIEKQWAGIKKLIE